MRKLFLTGALILGFVAAGSLLPGRAEAMPISSPAAVQDALTGNLAEQARFVCRRVWTGWGWRRSCRRVWTGWGWRRPCRPVWTAWGWRRSCAWRPYRPYRYYRYGWRY